MRKNDFFKHSIFLKIILIFLAAHLTIVAVGFVVHKYLNTHKQHRNMDKNMVYYGTLLMQQLGSPPDTVQAKKMADSLSIAVRFRSPAVEWSYPQQMNFTLPTNAHRFDGKKNIFIAYDGKGFYLLQKSAQSEYLLVFRTDIWQSSKAVQQRILSMVLFMMFILTIIYFVIRAMLKPLQQLEEAAREFSNGNLDYQLHTKRKDELGDLIRSFNMMAKRIKAMLKARDQLLLDASHELRSPLTRIKVALEFLPDSPAKQNIREDINEMETMISELLEKERLDSPYGGLHKTDVPLKEFVDKLCQTFSAQKPGIRFLAPRDEIVLHADKERLRSAIGNIVQNALKYSSAQEKPVEVSVSRQGKVAVITVRDYGQGIPENEIPFIFEPFYRVDKSRSKKTGGYGLGMSLAKKIIEAHGGTIDVQSSGGKGTQITIKISGIK